MHFEDVRGIYISSFPSDESVTHSEKQLLNYCQNTVGGNIISSGTINAAAYNRLHSDFSSTYCKVQRDGWELCGIRTNQRVC